MTALIPKDPHELLQKLYLALITLAALGLMFHVIQGPPKIYHGPGPVVTYDAPSVGQAGSVTVHGPQMKGPNGFLVLLSSLTGFGWLAVAGFAVYMWKKKAEGFGPLELSHIRVIALLSLGFFGMALGANIILGFIAATLPWMISIVFSLFYIYMMANCFFMWRNGIEATNENIEEQMKKPPFAALRRDSSP